MAEHKISLKITIGMFISALLVIVGSVILYIIYTKTSESLLSTSDQMIEQVASKTEEQINGYFSAPQAGLEQTLDQVKSGVLDVEDLEKLEAYFYSYMKIHQSVSLINYGDKNGNFLMVKRVGKDGAGKPDRRKGSLITKIIQRGARNWRRTYWKERPPAAPLNMYVEEEDPTDTYDPRSRPWYKHWVDPADPKNTDFPNYADHGGEVHWTDVYIFFEDQQPGITASAPYLDSEGDFKGVFSIDISLEDMSGFMSKIKVGKSGKAFVLDNKSRLIAVPGDASLVKMSNPSKEEKLKAELNVVATSSLGDISSFGSDDEFPSSLSSLKERIDLSFDYEGEKYLGSLIPLKGRNWLVGVVVPEDDFLGEIKHTLLIAVYVIMGVIFLSVIIGLRFTKIMSRSLQRLVGESQRIQNLDFSASDNAHSPFKEIHEVLTAFENMKVGLRSFGKYIPKKLVQTLMANKIEPDLGGDERDLTIMFSDIRSFTTISEEMGAMGLANKLGDYFSAITNIIESRDSQGIVDKYIGDSVMAMWGAPEPVDNHPYKACEAVLRCAEAIEKIDREQPDTPAFFTCFGIHTEESVVGHFGSRERLDYTCIGDGVNLSSRLEQINKYYGTQIVISEDTYKAVADHFEVRLLDIVAVKGKTQGVKIYELIGRSGEVSEEELVRAKQFSEGFNLYLERKWDDAFNIFARLRESNASDLASEGMVRRCLEYKSSPPDENWTGIYVMKSK